jgi:hypothetical protein
MFPLFFSSSSANAVSCVSSLILQRRPVHQEAVVRHQGAADFQPAEHWENSRVQDTGYQGMLSPSLRLRARYLLDIDAVRFKY